MLVDPQIEWVEKDANGTVVACVATARLVQRGGTGWWLFGSEDSPEYEEESQDRVGEWRPLGTSITFVERERPEIAAFEREHAAFVGLLPQLAANFGGRFVAIHKGNVVDSDASRKELVRRFFARFGDVPVYIGYVGKPALAYQVTPFRI